MLRDGWRLERQLIAGGPFEAVDAELLTPNPTSFVIVDGEITQVGYSFGVDDSTIFFGEGVLDLSIAVTEAGNADGVTQLVGGAYHSCALIAGGAVRCWGWAEYDQLGYGNFESIGDDELPASAGDVDIAQPVQQLAAGDDGTCGLLGDGSVECWGFWDDAALDHSARQIAAGWSHACAVLATGAVRCWGLGDWGELGYANTDSVSGAETRDVDVGGPVAQVSSRFLNTCVLMSTGAVRCWGANGANFSGTFGVGALGYANTESIGDNESPASAGDVDVGGPVQQIASGGGHTCALLTNGAVRCWGDGSLGQVGHGNTENIGDDETPASAGDIDIGVPVVQIAAGFSHTCALLVTGAVRCWGLNANGQLGYGNTENIGDDETPASAGDVPLGARARQIAAGGDHTCALLVTGAVRCWGLNANGQLGYGNTENIGDDETPASAGDVQLL